MSDIFYYLKRELGTSGTVAVSTLVSVRLEHLVYRRIATHIEHVHRKNT
jgi:hypothetical protein